MLGVLSLATIIGIIVAATNGSKRGGDGGGGHHVDDSDIGGLWLDPNHYDGDGTLKGTRFISDIEGKTASNTITVIGTDDGVSYYTIYGGA